MRPRIVIAAIALVLVVTLAMAGTLAPSLFGPPADSAGETAAPIAQASPPPTTAPRADPSPRPPSPSPSRPSPSPSPNAPPLVLQSTPPDWEIYPFRSPNYAGPVVEPPTDGSPDGSPPQPIPAGSSGAVASRVLVSSRRIDLPIVSGELPVRGNRNNYPLCDVAQYLTYFVQPGEEGTTYIYAHAQRGMFLPLLRASRRNNGREMIGQRVEVYTNEPKLYIYEITRVKRHSTDLNIGFSVPRGEQRLILQTSEGPHGHRPVMQVQAELVRVVDTTAAEAMPTPRPRACPPPR